MVILSSTARSTPVATTNPTTDPRGSAAAEKSGSAFSGRLHVAVARSFTMIRRVCAAMECYIANRLDLTPFAAAVATSTTTRLRSVVAIVLASPTRPILLPTIRLSRCMVAVDLVRLRASLST